MNPPVLKEVNKMIKARGKGMDIQELQAYEDAKKIMN
jgi:hypothetical protein